MNIQQCESEDVNEVYSLYEDARLLQIAKKMVVWPYFEKQFLENEMQKGQQWKLLINNIIACNWTIAFEDREIWSERDKGDAIYIHRIATRPEFKGNNFVGKLVEWANTYAANNNKRYIRLDTLGNNTRLITHYTNAGFSFLGMEKLTNTSSLPLHYQKEPNCCLFEIALW